MKRDRCRARRMTGALLLLSVGFAADAQEKPGPISPARALVVMNVRSEDSQAIARYYALKRRIPRANLCKIACPTTEECTTAQYRTQIETPIKQFIANNALRVDFILLTKGIPIRIKGDVLNGQSPDSTLTTMDLAKVRKRMRNPYFGQEGRFLHARYNLYLVTRLDGYTRADCLRLVDNALAARPLRGPFLLHIGPGHETPGYKPINDGMRRAHELLTRTGFQSVLSTDDRFAGGTGLMGYYSWGSNDLKYNKQVYHSLRFAAGAIAETVVSTSGRTFADPEARGQSLIADLIAQGVTGCKGYVAEPYADAIAVPDILFWRYTSGYTLAESFYCASRYLRWADIVIGDPLCAPYAARK